MALAVLSKLRSRMTTALLAMEELLSSAVLGIMRLSFLNILQ